MKRILSCLKDALTLSFTFAGGFALTGFVFTGVAVPLKSYPGAVTDELILKLTVAAKLGLAGFIIGLLWWIITQTKWGKGTVSSNDD